MFREIYLSCFILLPVFFVQSFQISNQSEWTPTDWLTKAGRDYIISSVWKINFSNFTEVYPTVQNDERKKIIEFWKKVMEDREDRFTDAESNGVNVRICRLKVRLRASKAYSNACARVKKCVLSTIAYIQERTFFILQNTNNLANYLNHTFPISGFDYLQEYRSRISTFLQDNDENLKNQLSVCCKSGQNKLDIDMSIVRYIGDTCIDKMQSKLQRSLLDHKIPN